MLLVAAVRWQWTLAARRALCTPSTSRTPPRPPKIDPSAPPPEITWKDRFSEVFEDPDASRFATWSVQRVYRADSLDPVEWAVIHRDPQATRHFFMLACGFVLVVVFVSAMVMDALLHDEWNRSSGTNRLIRDCEELGIFLAIPGLALVATSFVLFRLQQIRVLRIYQNRLNPTKYIAIGSRLMVFKHKIRFDRSTAVPVYPREGLHLYGQAIQFLIQGNCVLNGRRCLALDDYYLGNNYRSYMFGESNFPPKL